MEWWKIVLIVFGIVYTSLILYQIANHQFKKSNAVSVDKIKGAMIRADRQYENIKHEKRVKFILDKNTNTPPIYMRVGEFFANFGNWIVSILYSIEKHIQITIEWILEYIYYCLYVFSRKLGITNSNI